MLTRMLGRSEISVSALGMGCWAIGSDWGTVDDAESVRALQRALDLGVTFFDTANVYGCGHSERLLGQAVHARRHEVVIATKFGYGCDPETRRSTGEAASPEAIRRACETSLRNLGTTYIDLYQFHISEYDLALIEPVLETLELLVDEGKIRYYGWSTDDPERAQAFAQGAHCAAIQHQLNLFDDTPAMLLVCEAAQLASINRTPLAMGLLTGKYTAESEFPRNDIRSVSPWWDYFKRDKMPGLLKKLDLLHEILLSDGRTLAQAALGWVLARSSHTIPIPGFKTVAQVEENIDTLRLGPLSPAQMQAIDALLGRA